MNVVSRSIKEHSYIGFCFMHAEQPYLAVDAEKRVVRKQHHHFHLFLRCSIMSLCAFMSSASIITYPE